MQTSKKTLWLLTAVLLALVSVAACKPTETEDLRTREGVNGKTETQTVEETTFAQWTGRSDLKGNWTFENVP